MATDRSISIPHRLDRLIKTPVGVARAKAVRVALVTITGTIDGGGLTPELKFEDAGGSLRSFDTPKTFTLAAGSPGDTDSIEVSESELSGVERLWLVNAAANAADAACTVVAHLDEIEPGR